MSDLQATLPAGRMIRGRLWSPEGDAEAAVVIVHGFGEHVGRFERLADAFLARGWCCLGFDHPGHGRSPGARGHVPHYAWLLDEIDRAVAQARDLAPGMPLFLYGHSWGGNLLASWLLDRRSEHTAAVLSSPWLILGDPPAAWRVALARRLHRILPWLPQRAAIDANKLTRDPEEVAAYEADPLVHQRITLRTFVETTQAAERILRRAAELPAPLLVFQGKQDEVCSPEGARRLARANERILLREYEGRHELHHDLNAEIVIRETTDWMAAQIPSEHPLADG